jgi:hypothetical protein
MMPMQNIFAQRAAFTPQMQPAAQPPMQGAAMPAAGSGTPAMPVSTLARPVMSPGAMMPGPAQNGVPVRPVMQPGVNHPVMQGANFLRQRLGMY